MLVVVALVFLGAQTASAAQVITSPGPLTQISLGDDLACQLLRAGDPQPAFYAGNNAPGSCGTFIHTAGTLYGPPTAPAVISPAAYTPVAQTPVSGAGTISNPLRVTTVVDAGRTGLRITRTDSYATGLDAYRSDVTISNSSSVARTAVVYHAGDCLLNGSDASFGFFRPADRGIFCAVNANNTPAGRLLGFVPVSADSHYLESGADTMPDVWAAMNGSNFPDVCRCTTLQDSGAGLSWAVAVPAGGSVTRSLLTGFGASSISPPPAPPGPTASGLPDPILGKTVNAEPVSGQVFVAVPAPSRAAGRARAAQKGLRFVPLREARQVPVGSFFDTKRGRVRLRTATTRRGRRQAGEFFGGLFQTLQSRRRSAKGLVELRLKGSSFRRCATARRGSVANAARRSGRTIRRLRGNAKGRFRTRGRYSAATVRGTIWGVLDRCDGTLTRVTRGRVVVRDFRRKRTITVRQGKRYLVRAPG